MTARPEKGEPDLQVEDARAADIQVLSQARHPLPGAAMRHPQRGAGGDQPPALAGCVTTLQNSVMQG